MALTMCRFHARECITGIKIALIIGNKRISVTLHKSIPWKLEDHYLPFSYCIINSTKLQIHNTSKQLIYMQIKQGLTAVIP